MYGRPSRLTGGLSLSSCRLFFRPFGACVSSLASTACALGCTLSLLRSWVCVRWRFFRVVGWDCGGGRCDVGGRDCFGSLHGRFATGTDEGVCPYTCAGLRLRRTGESARPHTFLPMAAVSTCACSAALRAWASRARILAPSSLSSQKWGFVGSTGL